ncbi:flagellar basal-body rod protein FlgG [Heliobacillus mobilis]|uniref:Flagellar basal-body rod protein FlgG n=1 Tax=Heliobacterium mobile TaxID=28064 RepID=A0A6I3SL14_HELMO|nr:flagellar basal-body rod protein FlgG [Heliobacterium mobile]MTV49593.1 flagellar basal-body rod protein FlgG [Heliobacterium mobile]
MMRALYSAATGMIAQQLNMDTIANNLANVNTYGYKKNRAEFQDLLYSTMRNATAQVPTGMQVGSGTRPSSITTITTTGNMIQTESPTDLAITGEGYFRITNPNDDNVPFYTRDGSFKIDSQGYMVNADGYRLADIDPFPEGATKIDINSDGAISYQDINGDRVNTGQKIQLYTFTNPAGLTRQGRNLLTQSAASGDATGGDPNVDGRGGIAQRYLESSNVQVVDEMVNMITAQRAYEVSTKAIQSSDEMLGQANNLKR